jgi:hypothetical protein
MGKSFCTAVAASVVSLAALAPSVATAGTVDQSQTVQNMEKYFAAPDGGRLAQVFTAGRTGELDQVDVMLRRVCEGGYGPAVAIAELTPSGAGYYPYPELAKTDVADATVPATLDFLAVPFTPPVQVTAGTRYAIVLYGDSASYCVGGKPPYAWGGASGNPYAGGEPWLLPPEGGGLQWFASPDDDFAFRTYVTSPDAPPAGTCAGREATLTGTEAGESLRGTDDPDVIAGLAGADTLLGEGGEDRLCGDANPDTLTGGKGDDRLIGGPGRDVIRGNGGADVMIGGPGKDRCIGGAGPDRERGC